MAVTSVDAVALTIAEVVLPKPGQNVAELKDGVLRQLYKNMNVNTGILRIFSIVLTRLTIYTLYYSIIPGRYKSPT